MKNNKSAGHVRTIFAMCIATKTIIIMKIKYNGNEYEAYSLIMRKENALEIFNGTKRVEIRVFTPHYMDMFIDQEKLARNKKIDVGELDASEWSAPLKDTPCVHFYSPNGGWSLDVSIENIGIASMTQEDIEWLSSEYDFHDYDDEWQQFAGLPEEEIPSFFYICIEKILHSEGL